MSNVNNGNQLVLYHYHFPLDAYIFNRLNRILFPTGVYEGLQLQIIDDSTVMFNPGTLIIASNNSYDVVKIKFQSNGTVTVDPTNNRVVVRYEWQAQESWYADILAVTPGMELTTDIILGDVIYVGASASDISYDLRTMSSYKNVEMIRGVLNNYSDLSSYLNNNKIGDLFIVIDPSDDPNRFIQRPTIYIAKSESGSTIQDVWYTFELSAGTVVYWSGYLANIPSGWHVCDGTELSRTDYHVLFNAIGTIHGSGDGSTTFNLPNSIDRFIRCENVAGHTGGSDDSIVVDHAHSMQFAGDHSHTITGGSHTHGSGVQSPRDHTHSYTDWDFSSTYKAGNQSNLACNNVHSSYSTNYAGSHTHSISSGAHTHACSTDGSHLHTIDSTGVSGTNMNLPAYYSLIPIIKIF